MLTAYIFRKETEKLYYSSKDCKFQISELGDIKKTNTIHAKAQSQSSSHWYSFVGADMYTHVQYTQSALLALHFDVCEFMLCIVKHEIHFNRSLFRWVFVPMLNWVFIGVRVLLIMVLTVMMTKATATTTRMASLDRKIWNKMQNAFDMVTSVTHALTKIQCLMAVLLTCRKNFVRPVKVVKVIPKNQRIESHFMISLFYGLVFK